MTNIATKTYAHGIYISGLDPTGMDPDDRITVKIGQAGNNGNRWIRLGECQRQIPGAIEHTWFLTDEGDRPINEYLCKKWPLKFGSYLGAGRDVITLLVKDFQFLITEATKYFNLDRYGRAKVSSFPARQEQNDCLVKTEEFFSDPDNVGREFLWDCKMRFGKTHTAYKLVMDMDYKLILILTGRPTDTKQSWIDAMDHIDFDFDSVNFIDASEQKDIIVPHANKRTIIFASLQDLVRLNDGEFKEKFKGFPNLSFDLLIKDECHLSFDTEKTRLALSMFQYKHALNLSGTPFRALLEERFSDDAKFTWSYLDEQRVRNRELDILGQADSEKNGNYYWLCPMKIFTILLSNELYEDVDSFTEDEGFTFTKLFHVDYLNSRSIFRNDIAVNSFLNAISRGVVLPYSDQACNAHQYESINLKHALWYVPGVPEAKLLAEKLKKHKVFKKYDIIIAADDNGGDGNDTVKLVKGRIADVESGRNDKHIGTITLSCGKLSHGVSVPEWGSVFNLSDMRSSQLYFQLNFRGQTPWKGNKHECYVFDFNPNRTLSMLYDLAKAQANTSDPKPILEEMLNVFNVLSYDGNEFKPIDASDLIAKLQSGFGRSTSITGLQNLLAELQFDFDDDLIEGIDDIDDGSPYKAKDLDVNENDVPNGKNSNGGGGGGGNGGGKDPDKDKLKLEEQRKAKIKNALSKVPLFFFLTRDKSFDELIANLSNNGAICKSITGLPSKSLKKILEAQPKEKKQVINNGIVRFRSLEEMEHSSFNTNIER